MSAAASAPYSLEADAHSLEADARHGIWTVTAFGDADAYLTAEAKLSAAIYAARVRTNRLARRASYVPRHGVTL